MTQNEPHIQIYGVALTEGQAMAVRVACSTFLQEIADDPAAFGNDELGRHMAKAYADRLREVLNRMIAPAGGPAATTAPTEDDPA